MHRIINAVRGNIVAWLALFVALGGTSLAASHYIVTSTSQIKPSVRAALHGARGPQGPAGAFVAGPTGPQGLRGVEGPRGFEGSPGGEANLQKLCSAILSADLAAPSGGTLEKALNEIWEFGC